MKSASGVILLILLLCFLPKQAVAEIAIQDIVVIWEGPLPESVNLRVNLVNLEKVYEKAPISAVLYVRRDNSEQWREVKSWSNIHGIPPGFRVSRDYFPGAEGKMDPVLYDGAFQVRATVTTPDGRSGWREETFPVLYLIPELGITVERCTPGIAIKSGITPGGIMVQEVIPSGPAGRAGIRTGDVIVELGKSLVMDVQEFVEILSFESPGAEDQISFFRNSKRMYTTLTIDKSPVTMTEKEKVLQEVTRPAARSSK